MEAIIVYLITGGGVLLFVAVMIAGWNHTTTPEEDELFNTMLILGMLDSPKEEHSDSGMENHHDTYNNYDDDLMDTMIACDMLD